MFCEKNREKSLFKMRSLVCTDIYVGWSDHCQLHIWFLKERKVLPRKREKKGIEDTKRRKKKFYRLVIGVGALLLGVRKGKFLEVGRVFGALVDIVDGGLFRTLEEASRRSFCVFADFVVSSVWFAKTNKNES